MGSIGNKLGKAGLALASFAFRIAFYACMGVLIFWAGRQSYSFGYRVFNQQAVSPGEGTVVTVSIPTGAGDYEVAKILETRGLVDDALVFLVQEYLAGYWGSLGSGRFDLSTAYTPQYIMSVLAGEGSE